MKRIFILFSSLFIMSFSAHAFKFSPMSTTIEINGKNPSVLFSLENDSDQPIAISASLLKRELSQSGEEKTSPIKDELTLYPSQLIISPNEKRSIKVSWTARGQVTSEQAYRLIAEQMPIEMDKNKNKKASIKVLLRYVAALYVGHSDFQSDIVLKKFEVDDKKVSFTVINNGKKHQVLSNLSMKISGSKNLDLNNEDLKGMSGENVLALSERTFTFLKTGKFKDINPADKVKINFEKD